MAKNKKKLAMCILGPAMVAAIWIGGTAIQKKGEGLINPDFTVTESTKEKLKEFGFGFQYDFCDKKGNLVYRIIPDNNKKIGEFKDAYLVLDSQGKMVYAASQKMMGISCDIYNTTGKIEKSLTLDYNTKTALTKVDTYRMFSANNEDLLTIKEKNTFSNFNRKFEIQTPAGQNIGQICSKYTPGEFWTKTNRYDVKLIDKSPETVKNIATAIRWVDRVEDAEASE